MKFDYIIGNPPYQETQEKTSDKPIYHLFMESSYSISDRVELITPARFLFQAGKTPKEWNRKMLSDRHFKILHYEQNSTNVFPNTDIKGGVAISYRDEGKDYGAIEVFTSFIELNSIRNKIVLQENFDSLSKLVYAPESYKFAEKLHQDFPNLRFGEENGRGIGVLSKGHDYDVVTNIFSKLPDIFVDAQSDDCYGFVGLINNKRYTKWIKKKYIRNHENIDGYKVILPKSNGSGAIGEVLSTPLIGEPLIGHTQSFISIGNFENHDEAYALLCYLKTKFARAALGILKITQDNKKSVWKYVPLQDFTPNSDIDWSQSIADIDQQLYKKYGLSPEEIAFIETHVKEMN